MALIKLHYYNSGGATFITHIPHVLGSGKLRDLKNNSQISGLVTPEAENRTFNQVNPLPVEFFHLIGQWVFAIMRANCI